MHLDAKTVAGLELGAKHDVIYFDGTLKGFGYRIRRGAAGKVLRSWIVQYKRAGSTRRLLIGSAEVLSADQARAAARKVLAKVALGEDPQADKADRRGKDRVSLKSIIEEYLQVKQQQVRAQTFRELTRYLTGPYFRSLQAMPLDKVTRKEVAARLVGITRESSSITAARARSALSAFYVWCLRMGLVEANPVINTFQPEDSEGRARVLTDQELVAIWCACGDDDYGRIVRLLILLACRRREIGGMTWSEIDLELEQWTLPASRSKNHEALTLPLLPMALEIIREVPRMVSRDQLFGTRGAGFADWSRSKAALDERCGVTGWTLHDIRRTVATTMANRLGVLPHVVETILNHTGGHKAGVAGIYNKAVYANEVRTALAKWEDHIRALVSGEAHKLLLLPRVAN